MSDVCEFGSLDEANEILGLMMRHWNDIAGTLNKDEVYGPILLQDENGVFHGNDWARGFMRGMGMRSDGWAELVNGEEHGGCLIPMTMLCHEHDTDSEMRPERSVRRSAKKSSCTWRLGCCRRIGTSGSICRSVPVPTRLSLGAPLPVRLRTRRARCRLL
jgi:yecA family protein